MLAQMTRHVLNADNKLKELADLGMVQIETGLLEMLIVGLVGIVPSPTRHEAGDTTKRFRLESHHLTHFPRRRPAAICDHVRCHRGSSLAVPFIDMLDDSLASFPGGQIQIDVGPFPAFF